MLKVDVEKRYGAKRIAAAFETAGQVTALFGPSGAGKTTIVEMIAGLVTPDRGRVTLGDRVLFDAARRIDVPAHRRRVGYVFQDARLFPHLSVARNLNYGRWMRGLKADRANENRIVEMLGIGALLGRRPAGLSGGERQRVAIGRALLSEPEILLLDEPLASLDAARKDEVLPYLDRLRTETRMPIVYVTHVEAEAQRLSAESVRIDGS